MIAISSHRPFKDSAPISKNQCDAKSTWESVFDEIIYFGESEPALVSPKTVFISWDGKPAIKDMAKLASRGFGWRALINADIQVSPRLKQAERLLKIHGAKCAFSFRIPVGKTSRVDLGIDFFCAETDVWKHVASIIPDAFTIGRQKWDTWLVSFFMKHYWSACFDLSPSKLIYHPDHGERGDQSMEFSDSYIEQMVWRCSPLKF